MQQHQCRSTMMACAAHIFTRKLHCQQHRARAQAIGSPPGRSPSSRHCPCTPAPSPSPASVITSTCVVHSLRLRRRVASKHQHHRSTPRPLLIQPAASCRPPSAADRCQPCTPPRRRCLTSRVQQRRQLTRRESRRPSRPNRLAGARAPRAHSPAGIPPHRGYK
jgi:hypothetical protein